MRSRARSPGEAGPAFGRRGELAKRRLPRRVADFATKAPELPCSYWRVRERRRCGCRRVSASARKPARRALLRRDVANVKGGFGREQAARRLMPPPPPLPPLGRRWLPTRQGSCIVLGRRCGRTQSDELELGKAVPGSWQPPPGADAGSVGPLGRPGAAGSLPEGAGSRLKEPAGQTRPARRHCHRCRHRCRAKRAPLHSAAPSSHLRWRRQWWLSWPSSRRLPCGSCSA